MPLSVIRLSLIGAAAATAATALLSAPSAIAAASPDASAPAVRSVACGHDTWAVSITPAAGFNPLTATAAQLSANGYPARPRASNPHELAQWRAYATTHHAEKSSCSALRSVPREYAESAHASASQAPEAADASPGTTKDVNWAGYQSYGTFSDAEAQWDIPTAASTALADVASTAWVGIGTGDAQSEPLIQAGTWSDPAGSSPYLWYEVYPEESVIKVTGVSPAPGDLVGAHITEYAGYKPGGCTAPACGTIHVWDDTKDFNHTYTVGGDWYDSSSAEWIYERPCTNNADDDCLVDALTDAPPTFTEAQAVSGGDWHPLGALNGLGDAVDIYSMYNCTSAGQTSQELAHPYSITDGGYDFGNDWQGYGTANACKA